MVLLKLREVKLSWKRGSADPPVECRTKGGRAEASVRVKTVQDRFGLRIRHFSFWFKPTW
jgi:hypothetical protein